MIVVIVDDPAVLGENAQAHELLPKLLHVNHDLLACPGGRAARPRLRPPAEGEHVDPASAPLALLNIVPVLLDLLGERSHVGEIRAGGGRPVVDRCLVLLPPHLSQKPLRPHHEGVEHRRVRLAHERVLGPQRGQLARRARLGGAGLHCDPVHLLRLNPVGEGLVVHHELDIDGARPLLGRDHLLLDVAAGLGDLLAVEQFLACFDPGHAGATHHQPAVELLLQVRHPVGHRGLDLGAHLLHPALHPELALGLLLEGQVEGVHVVASVQLGLHLLVCLDRPRAVLPRVRSFLPLQARLAGRAELCAVVRRVGDGEADAVILHLEGHGHRGAGAADAHDLGVGLGRADDLVQGPRPRVRDLFVLVRDRLLNGADEPFPLARGVQAGDEGEQRPHAHDGEGHQGHLPNLQHILGGDGELLRARHADLGWLEGYGEVREMGAHAVDLSDVLAVDPKERLCGEENAFYWRKRSKSSEIRL
mmetsp:Transcript_38339/g.121038  ORF Transcript_38339/g.121038 Transcript_38339/m.121038 type:complete len:476 (+) Transcript_38339:559-1986(+)